MCSYRAWEVTDWFELEKCVNCVLWPLEEPDQSVIKHLLESYLLDQTYNHDIVLRLCSFNI